MTNNHETSGSNPESDAELEGKAIYEDLNGNRIRLPDLPYNHKWFKGEFHTAPWGSDQSPFAGNPKDRVRVSMPGEKMKVTVRNRVGSSFGVITAVLEDEDRRFIGEVGWWRTESLSDSGKKRSPRRRKI
jgi:hypothetical protein